MPKTWWPEFLTTCAQVLPLLALALLLDVGVSALGPVRDAYPLSKQQRKRVEEAQQRLDRLTPKRLFRVLAIMLIMTVGEIACLRVWLEVPRRY